MKEKNILCFGDSNTHGAIPNFDSEARFSRSDRWTSILAESLAKENIIIYEEGLNGRTINQNDDLGDERDIDINGKTMLPMLLKTHKYIDVLLIALGTNDCKDKFKQSAQNIVDNLEELIDLARPYLATEANIVVLGPIEIAESIASDGIFSEFSTQSVAKATEVYKLLPSLCASKACLFFPTRNYAVPGRDKLHMEASSHRALAEALLKFIKANCL